YWTNPAPAKSGYSPVYRLNNQSEPLTDTIVQSHLSGNQTIGIYPLLSDNTTYFLAIDFDKLNWLKESTALLQMASKYTLPGYLERSRSGNGGHVWFFFETNIAAWKARQLGKLLLSEANIFSRKTFDRMFPSQNEHTGKGFGNLIALPLQGKAVMQKNMVFMDDTGEPHPDQWSFLQTCRKISLTLIDVVLRVKPTPTPVAFTKLQEISSHTDEPEDSVKTNQTQEVKLIFGNQIFIPELYLPDVLYKFLKSKLNFPNPQFYELERRGYSTWNTPRFLKHIEKIENGILVPAGILSEIETFAINHNLTLQIKNQQTTNTPIRFSTTLSLRPEQQKVAKKILMHDRAILEAHPAFGKTMVAFYCMKRRSQKTLIIVHTMALLAQWKKRITEWFVLKKDDLGIIGENKWQIGEKITVASYQTLARRGTQELKNSFGHIIVDECHHVPAHTFTNVVKQLSATYVLGLTATAFRKDQLDRLMTFYIGQIIKIDGKIPSAMQPVEPTVETKLVTRKTPFQLRGKQTHEFSHLASLLIADEARNIQIATDVAEALRAGMKCLVLSERIEHCQTLLAAIRKEAKGIHGAIAEGNMTKNKRGQLMKRIHQEQFQLLIATGKLIGEGFDWPELTHLFLAFPFSWKGKLIQYVGRVQRSSEGKEMAYVYDYADFDVPMLKIMYFKRLRTYRALGLSKEKPHKSYKSKISENQLGLF
ncbi:DEAD/DEAH box helicase family protein, partial [Candidatus Gottesmanbacteria bacterium]|nr:DEAD/DEAH box helicase family protein [Candidatus Gottesmanbacteria bacterium]